MFRTVNMLRGLCRHVTAALFCCWTFFLAGNYAVYVPVPFTCDTDGIQAVLPITIGQSESDERRQIEDAVLLAIDYVNADPLVMPASVKLAFYNSSIPQTFDQNPTTRTTSVDACAQIERINAIAMLGGSSSAHEMSINDICKESGVVELAFSATNPLLPGVAEPHFFLRTIPNDRAQGGGMPMTENLIGL
jgi:ABC-type branched-subunit amino acid transport system substrate-binding protein